MKQPTMCHAHLVLNDELLRDIIKVPLAHLLEPFPDIFLYKLLLFLHCQGDRIILMRGRFRG